MTDDGTTTTSTERDDGPDQTPPRRPEDSTAAAQQRDPDAPGAYVGETFDAEHADGDAEAGWDDIPEPNEPA